MSGQKRMRSKATVQRKLAGERKSNDRSKSKRQGKSGDACRDSAVHLAEGRLSDRLHSLAHQPKLRVSGRVAQAASPHRNGTSLHVELSPFDSIASSVIALMVLAARSEAAQRVQHQNAVVAKAALARLISTRFSDDD
jgi:hypothetical protein